jgi:hypothetical protein
MLLVLFNIISEIVCEGFTELVIVPLRFLYQFSTSYLWETNLDPVCLIGLAFMYAGMVGGFISLIRLMRTSIHILIENTREKRKERKVKEKESWLPKYQKDVEFEELYERYCS